MKTCLNPVHLSKVLQKKTNQLSTTHCNYIDFNGTLSAFLNRIMRMKLRQIIGFVTLGLVVSIAATAEGGSHGGTNTDRASKEPVEFARAGVRERIDPRTFRGIYNDLLPRLRAIETKIPGLGKELLEVFDERSWFITDREFKPRNENEEQPIFQDKNHVYLTGAKISEMTHEQLKRAWLHEMVRRLVHDGRPAMLELFPHGTRANRYDLKKTPLTQAQIDELVENLTVVLYTEYDMPDVKLAKYINEKLGKTIFQSGGVFENGSMGYLSRQALDFKILKFDLKEKYTGVCEANQIKLPRQSIAAHECTNANKKNPEEAQKFVDACVAPELQKSVLESLNRLRKEGLEFDNHFPSLPFRTYGVEAYNGVDIYEFAPANKHVGAEWGLNFAELALTPAIHGAETKEDGKTELLTDPQRIFLAVIGCVFTSMDEEAVKSIKRAQSPVRPGNRHAELEETTNNSAK